MSGGVMIGEASAEALKEVGFSEPAGAMNEEGVVLNAGEFGDIERGVVGELIGWPDDERGQVMSEPGKRGRRGGVVVGVARGNPGDWPRRRGAWSSAVSGAMLLGVVIEKGGGGGIL